MLVHQRVPETWNIVSLSSAAAAALQPILAASSRSILSEKRRHILSEFLAAAMSGAKVSRMALVVDPKTSAEWNLLFFLARNSMTSQSQINLTI